MEDGATLRCIGQGFCGSVWAPASLSAMDHAIKREDGSPWRSLLNDYEMHRKVLSTLTTVNAALYSRVPSCRGFIPKDDEMWWSENASHFPTKYQIHCNVLISDRIPPFPKLIRDKLIDCYCPEPLQTSIKTSIPDEDCLIRPYLGRRRRHESQSRFKAFSLRNYPLHIDQIEALGLDPMTYAKRMANTLALLYWSVHIDANDIEFVLAPATALDKNGRVGKSSIIHSEALGDHVLWILDFDCCREMAMNEDGVKQAVAAFYRNDPFYPRPGKESQADRDLWVVFKEEFSESSRRILGQDIQGACLASLWIDLVEKRSHG